MFASLVMLRHSDNDDDHQLQLLLVLFLLSSILTLCDIMLGQYQELCRHDNHKDLVASPTPKLEAAASWIAHPEEASERPECRT